MALMPQGMSRLLVHVCGLIACLLLGVAADDHHSRGKGGYVYGQPMPVTCLNRTIDSGEHITDNLGKLQYIPFPTCNETFLPLALRYGVSETLTCTVFSLSDELYHLLEYYVHSDVPMTCRVPTSPLTPLSGEGSKDHDHDHDHNGDDDDDKKEKRKENKRKDELSALDTSEPSYTPLTFALQGTLQRSHLHIWTDMNVLVHNIASSPDANNKYELEKKNRKRKSKSKFKQASPGYVVAGTAYSTPEFDTALLLKDQKTTSSAKDKEEKAAIAVAGAARGPWTAGHGTKVIRGEPLTFTFHVSWVEGGSGIGWPFPPSELPLTSSVNIGEDSDSSVRSFFSKLFFFILSALVGGLAALHYERNRRAGWRGDGILGAPLSSSSSGRSKGPAGIVYGNSGRMNGYGGYPGGSPGMSNGGCGGFGSGKRD